ncbi:MAG: ECF transporter S component [Candidatus Bathyarchaeia archaeon]|nr:ECF transporter S component [Candidatus Bathyarchaeota archaeon]
MSEKSNKIFFLFLIFSLFILVILPLILAFLNVNFLLEKWSLISFGAIIITITGLIIDFRKHYLNSRIISLTIALGALTALLRIPFAPLPNVNPCTYLIICSGIAFGSHIGFFIGVLTPLISNLLLGHGPWTPLQMYSWGLIGGLAGSLNFNHYMINRWKLGLLGFIAGYLYGFIMNIWFWYSYFYPINLTTFIIAELQGLPFDTFHAIGNFAFLIILGDKTLKVFLFFKEGNPSRIKNIKK